MLRMRPAASAHVRLDTFLPVARSALHRIPAVDWNGRTGHEIGRGAREKYRYTGEVIARAPTARGRAREDPIMQSGDLLSRAACEVGVDPTRQHRVRLDVVGRPCNGERFRELHDAA